MATATDSIGTTQNDQSKVWEWLTTVDHKKIGTMYGITGFTYFLISGVTALAIRTQLAVPRGEVLSAELYNQFFTMHALMMIFLAIRY